jgi:hypothetical protein
MATYTDSKYKIFQLRAVPAGLFGETYVVATGIHKEGDNYSYETFVITQRPQPALSTAAFPVCASGVPEELLTIDLDFLVEEGRQQGENRIIDRLSELAEERNRPELLSLQVQLEECPGRPFVGCWMRGLFHDQIREIAHSTECASLAKYLSLVASISYSRSPG